VDSKKKKKKQKGEGGLKLRFINNRKNRTKQGGPAHGCTEEQRAVDLLPRTGPTRFQNELLAASLTLMKCIADKPLVANPTA
jgi:hypothetical protein